VVSKTTNKFAPEVRERAIRMVLDHEPRQANEILRKASTCFPQAELDRPVRKWPRALMSIAKNFLPEPVSNSLR
jgi:hypothetical protein